MIPSHGACWLWNPALLPESPALNRPDVDRVDAVEAGQNPRYHLPAEVAQHGDGLQVELAWAHVTPLPMHVSDVVELGSKEEVIDVDAAGNIALMENAEPFWNWSALQLPGDPVREKVAAPLAARSDLSVAVGVDRSRPEVAPSRGGATIDFALESQCNGDTLACHENYSITLVE